MRASHGSHLRYCYLNNRRRRIEYAIRNLEGGPYASGEKGLSGGAGARG